MANSISVTMSLEDRGKSIQRRAKEVQDLNRELERTTKLGAQAVRAQPKAAGFAGEVTNYGVERGATGRTGASARDFANEAQGLGGLVRLYATYAANVFAVSAAFTALRDAMNTDMMIRGLDQLGAASGVALGGLAKQFSAVTDGAISLRESMESTAKAISSGLSQQQFLELGKVAKGAAQALGVNMSDAVSRLTRGITKLEPELLDELGIFTKVGKATEDYAKSVGKSVTSLTDFERRQAFANAVLEEGRQKFGEIAMESNPYDQLLASLKDVAQNILSVVNTVVAPIAKLLADNVALIGAAIAAAGLKIVNQALPALGQWQKGLAAAAADAAEKASQIQESFGETWVERAQTRAGIPEIDRQIEASQLRLREIEKERLALANQTNSASTGYKNTSKALAILKADEALSEQQIAALSREKTRTENLTTKNSVLQADALKRRIELEKQSLEINKQLTTLQTRRDAAYTAIGQQAERPDIGEWSRAQISRDAQVRAARLSLISGVASNVEKGGLATLKDFFNEVDSNTALAGNNFQKLKTKGTGALIGIATSAKIAGGALLSFISGPLQLGILAFTALDMLFSSNTKQASEFTNQLDLTTESVKTASNVLEKFTSTISAESINARANAFTSLNDSISAVTSALKEADNAASWFDKFIDGIKEPFGKDLKTKYSNQLADAIFSSIQQLPEGEAKKALQDKIKKITGSTDISQEGLKKSISSISATSIVAFGKEASAAISQYGRSLQDAQAYTQDILTSQKALQESLASVARSSAKLTEYDKALQDLAKGTLALERSFGNITSASATFADILDNKVNVGMLNTTEILSTLRNATAFESLNQEARSIEEKIARIRKGLSELTAGSSIKLPLEREIDGLNSRLAEIANKQRDILKQQVETFAKASERLADLQIAGFRSKLAAIGIQGEIAKVDKLPFKTEESINKRAQLEKSLISAEMQQTTATNNLTLAMYKMELTARELSLSLKEQPIQEAILKAQQAGDRETVRGLELLLAPISEQRRPLSQQLKLLDSQNIEGILKSAVIPESIKNALSGNAQAYRTAAQRTQQTEITRKQDLITTQFQNTSKSLDDSIKVIEEVIKQEQSRPVKDLDLLERLNEGLSSTKSLKLATEATMYEDLVRATGVTGPVSTSQIEEARQRYRSSLGMQSLEESSKDVLSGNQSAKSAQDLIDSLRTQNDLRTQSRELELQGLSIQEQALSRSLELGLITQSQFDLEAQKISNKRISLDLESKLAEFGKQEAAALKSIAEQLNQENLDPKLKQALEDLSGYIMEFYQNAEQGAKSWASAQRQSNQLLTESQQRTKNFNEFGKNLFEGFGNAIVDFAETGKWSFKDMVTSMVADLARLEMKMLTMKMYEAAGGSSGIVNAIIGAFSGSSYAGTGIDPTSITGADITAAFSGVRAAKGGVFDTGMLKFAKGGAFTNQIVNTPTQFKFAQGAGIMGEAGPEAIMPLQRDNRGNLGVRAQGGGTKVDVVVNNYSSEKAEAKEVVDSRGNRRIEVTIGELVAAEVARSNSPVNQSIKNSFATRPNLIRR